MSQVIDSDPLTTMLSQLAAMSPAIAGLAEGAGDLLALVKTHGVLKAPAAAVYIDTIRRVTEALEAFTSTCVVGVPQLRAVLDELTRMHEAN